MYVINHLTIPFYPTTLYLYPFHIAQEINRHKKNIKISSAMK
ncbi:hypothetical protein CSC18_3312 [Klebsiella aerogenes]|nr:hypothetical protein CSC18_3312 [Klebsiella aerogenes]